MAHCGNCQRDTERESWQGARRSDHCLLLHAGGDDHLHRFPHSGFTVEASLEHPCFFSPVIGSDGAVALFLQHDILVQVHPSGSIRVINRRNRAMVGMSSPAFGGTLYVEHPCVAKMEYCSGVVSLALEKVLPTDVFAKITKRGCLFTMINHGLVYLVDSSGVKSTTESFVILSDDLSKRYFYNGSSKPSETDFLECEALMSSCRNYTTNVGTVVWIVDQIRIKQSTDGTVNVHGMLGDTRICLTTSPSEDVGLKFGDDLRVSMRCPTSGASSMDSSLKYLDLSRGRIRLTADRRGFHARNGSHVAGFDTEMKFKLE